MIVEVEINNCNNCPFSETETKQVGRSTDNEYMLEFFCSKLEGKKITIVDFNEKVEIPNFCPLVKK